MGFRRIDFSWCLRANVFKLNIFLFEKQLTINYYLYYQICLDFFFESFWNNLEHSLIIQQQFCLSLTILLHICIVLGYLL